MKTIELMLPSPVVRSMEIIKATYNISEEIELAILVLVANAMVHGYSHWTHEDYEQLKNEIQAIQIDLIVGE
jgi:hypothetical protein